MKEYESTDTPAYVSALLDERAEMFTQKKFRHSQSKMRPDHGMSEKARREKSPAIDAKPVAKKELGKV